MSRLGVVVIVCVYSHVCSLLYNLPKRILTGCPVSEPLRGKYFEHFTQLLVDHLQNILDKFQLHEFEEKNMGKSELQHVIDL